MFESSVMERTFESLKSSLTLRAMDIILTTLASENILIRLQDN